MCLATPPASHICWGIKFQKGAAGSVVLMYIDNIKQNLSYISRIFEQQMNIIL